MNHLLEVRAYEVRVDCLDSVVGYPIRFRVFAEPFDQSLAPCLTKTFGFVLYVPAGLPEQLFINRCVHVVTLGPSVGVELAKIRII